MIRLLGVATLLNAVALFAVPAPAADEKPDAEKLFKVMKEKLAKAKTLECVFQGKSDADKKTTFEGSLYVVEGDKARFELSTEESDGKKRQLLFVSDGKKHVAFDGERKLELVFTKELNRKILDAIGRSCVHFIPMFMIVVQGTVVPEEKIEDLFKVSDLKLGKKEKVGDAETQAIENMLDQRGFKELGACTLWIDLKTQLPVKRTMTVGKGDGKCTFTETYTKFILDGKIDPAKFELPK